MPLNPKKQKHKQARTHACAHDCMLYIVTCLRNLHRSKNSYAIHFTNWNSYTVYQN